MAARYVFLWFPKPKKEGTLPVQIRAENPFFTQDLPVQSDIPQGASG